MLSAKQVAPGQTGEIEVSVSTEGIAAVNKTVTVMTNDPRQRQVVLNITAEVEPEFVPSERTINLGNVPKGREESRSIVITIAVDRAVRLLSAESNEASFAARLDPVAGTEGKKVKLICVMKADANEGYHFGILVVKTSSPFTPELKIPVRGMVVAAQND